MQENTLIPANEFCLHHNIELSFIYQLQEFGLIEVTTKENEVYIPAEQLCELEKITRLHYELNINMEGIDAIFHLLKRLEAAEEEVNMLRNKLRRYKDMEE